MGYCRVCHAPACHHHAQPAGNDGSERANARNPATSGAVRGRIDMTKIGERTITIDCDVIQADGGTRCASITGGFVALYDALNTYVAQGIFEELPIKNFISAISVGLFQGQVLVDLNYHEDSKVDVDMNVIENEHGGFVEVQGTGERGFFNRDELNQLLDAAQKANAELIALQKRALGLS